jgi:hypothetical protein
MNDLPKASKQPKPQGSPLVPWERDRLKLERHLSALVEADLQAAREAMEMSQEHLPEIYLIAQNQFPREWATALMNSDSMGSLLSRSPSPVKEMLQAPDLQSLLEMLP